MKLGTKISLGFTAVLSTGILLGGISVLTMNGSVDRATTLSTRYVPKADLAVNIANTAAVTMLATRSYGLTGQEKYLTDAKKHFGELDLNISAADKLATDQKLPKFADDLVDAKVHAKEFAEKFKQTEECMVKLVTVYASMNASAAGVTKSADDFLESQAELMRHELEASSAAAPVAEATGKGWAKPPVEAEGAAKVMSGGDKLQRFSKVSLMSKIIEKVGKIRIACWKGQAQRNMTIVTDVMPEFEEAVKLLMQVKEITKLEEHLKEIAEISKGIAEYKHDVSEMLALNKELSDIGMKRAEAGEALGKVADKAAEEGLKQSVDEAKLSMDTLKSSSQTVLGGLAVMIITGVLLAFFITRGITRALMRMVTDLASCSDETASAAEQVAGGAQSLADGTSKTAAALEETSASLEEMGSMVKQTAASSSSASTLAGEGNGVALGKMP